MSKESVLKKDFQEKDVQRLRNLVQGKYGEKTRTSVGFPKKRNFTTKEIYGKQKAELGL